MSVSPSPPPDAGDLSVGSILDGRYRIDALLGSGGMGRVYRGEHTGIGRQVAIKVLHADLNRNREAAQRFQREALASGRLDHPNIVGVSDFGVIDDGPCYLVMEALDGESVGDRLERDKRIMWPEAVTILRGVLAGLHHAHERGVVHRDIKPDNIFLARKDGELVVKILDFGIAKLYAGNADDPAATRAGLTVGTPAYLSPEQAVGGAITPASDLYSATIVLFEMITGRTPFHGLDPLAMLGAHVSRTPATIAELAPELAVPPALETVIQRGLTKQAAQRIGSAIEYLALLEGVLGELQMTRGSGQHPSTSPDLLGTMPTTELGAFESPIPTMTPVPGSLAGLSSDAIATATASPSMTIAPVPGMTPMPGMTPPPGSMPAGMTPMPGMTPPPGSMPAGMTPMPGVTPMPGSMPVVTTSVAAVHRPQRRWPVLFGLVALAIVVIALVARSGSRSTKKTAALPVAIDPDVAFKAAVHDLQSGKTCEDRKEAIGALVRLRDKRAIQPLRTARYRMRGGVLGIGQDNTNACLKSDAEAAIKSLGGTIR